MATYVMSDIHGQYDKYRRMLEKIRFSDADRLFVLGDAIDRGEDSAGVLLDVLERRNVTLLLGNHEYLMMDSVNSDHSLALWLKNGADSTIDKLLDAGVVITDLIPKLKECPVQKILEVNGKHYCLCHAYPADPSAERDLYVEDLSHETRHRALWSRELTKDMRETAQKDAFWRDTETVYLIGHTPVFHCPYVRLDKEGYPVISGYEDKIINLDCGCGKRYVMGAMRLEDGEEYYIR